MSEIGPFIDPLPPHLIDVAYKELRRLAKSYLNRERPDHTLQPTALVHEAYLRVIDQDGITWRNREHFIGVAATMMRRILVNHAIHRKRDKRGGSGLKISLAMVSEVPGQDDMHVLDLHEALSRLAEVHPDESRVVELRYFGGLSISETANVMGVSETTVKRAWSFARAWLWRELNDG